MKTDQPPADASARRPVGSFSAGAEIIESYLRTMPASPGVYRMLNKSGDILYVGKAKNLKKRVVAYTRAERLPLRLQRMVSETASMEMLTTHTEVEALLLEANLIKRLGPRYNILLKDDKSFPYILITGDHPWPQIVKHRGARNRKGEYFGPFASAGAVNQTLSHLQRAFLLRSCTDSAFSTRSRPCLLFQIKRCSAPCVERIGHIPYEKLVSQARAFLSGQSQSIQRELVTQMEEASEAMNYEEAAVYRDRIRALSQIQARQDINPLDIEEADVVALHQAGGQACIQVFFFRSGCNFGNRSFFPAQTQDQSPEDILAAFLGQFYDDKPPPKEILLSHSLAAADESLLTEALSQKAGHKVVLATAKRGDRRKMMEHAHDNAREALGRRMAESSAQTKLLAALAELFVLDSPPERIEVYDNSHIQGTNAVGGMIVAGPEGFNRNEYRKFNIRSEDLSPGDDFGMMREVLTRRFRRAQKEDPDRERGHWPDLVLIDGGQGQLQVAIDVLIELGIEDVLLVGVSKGPDRNAGRERFHVPGKAPFSLPPNDPVLYFLQRLRDEAHRFAIGSHRARRSKAISSSPLDDIAGIGAHRKKALLHHFGSARGVSEAGLADLQAVDGISATMAQKIYDHFHPTG
ncbi:excinuclease ABC subunit UvrC [Telmatospirillum sp.]|uniref:excinuclease ABC subunit UvrC n=1 Tax=Telmatospirillum sp. TaxID=2079197 RepID=UPI00283E910A|nr:excinuclease ABC subunit UvrC [Telmatospirillum sp.]MDR3438464.1 excinuclease ABC subunit UvrC [Telmatospirillum sp.]